MTNDPQAQHTTGTPPTELTTAASQETRPDARPGDTTDAAFPFLGPPQVPNDLGALGPYRVTGLLGQGGMGLVFRGEDEGLRRPVALKVMRPEYAAHATPREWFLREGRAAAGLRSDHVVVIYQVGEHAGLPFLAMELLVGATLEDWLRGQGGRASVAATSSGASKCTLPRLLRNES